jgi:poly(hydroxyalkanoate) depolymerase family esterase
MRAVLAAAVVPLIVGAVLMVARPAAAASLTQVTTFGVNPTGLNMYIYVPNVLAKRPALLVLVHFCGGSADAVFGWNGHDYVTAADRYGYIIVLPEATRDGHCFDVSTPAALRRNGGGDSTGIMSMVAYARSHYNIDPARIVVSGISSGAMMTNVLAAEYPDVFSAAVAFSGVPAGCFATTDGSLWNGQCSSGNVIKTAQQWGSLAHSMFPGYAGRYPRIQLWHGTTDTTLAYPNFGEEIKLWTNLHGLSQTPSFTDYPQSAWTRTRYGNTGTQAPVEGVSISGTGHTLPQPGMLGYAISFLGLDGTVSGTQPTASATPAKGATPSTRTSQTSTPSSSATLAASPAPSLPSTSTSALAPVAIANASGRGGFPSVTSTALMSLAGVGVLLAAGVAAALLARRRRSPAPPAAAQARRQQTQRVPVRRQPAPDRHGPVAWGERGSHGPNEAPRPSWDD